MFVTADIQITAGSNDTLTTLASSINRELRTWELRPPHGVGSANLLYLPIAGKMKIRIREEQIIREMTLEGVASILEGMNPHMLETKLLSFLVAADQSHEKQLETSAK